MASIEEIYTILKETFTELDFTLHQEDVGDPWILIPYETVHKIAQFVKEDERLVFNSLMNLTGVDYPPDFIAVIYHLHSLHHRHRLVLKLMAPREGAEVPSVSNIWGLANWMEREVFDLLGLKFSGHPYLKRLLMPSDWVGHPLRKDYQEQSEYNGIPTVRETRTDTTR